MSNHNKEKDKDKQIVKKRQCGCGKHHNATEHKEAIKQMPKEKPNDLIPAKFFVCEYCANYFEDIQTHLLECEVKKYLEEEEENYNKSIKERVRFDEKIASQIDKEEQKNKVDDEKVAKQLQLEYEKQKEKETMNDIDIAKKLQEELNKQNPLPNDAEIAQKLQSEYQGVNESNLTDEEIAKRFQNEFNDTE